ncbi:MULTISPECIES: hypothetical protein [Trichocoleus]|uniref:Uncharacterized protein n=1 Tax=Trichocoleus desertorum GB2-A4 TaxID=2933944 RepID=A0ABV0JBJ3_9CYAN|nr:hypothetical protein [Trichocoleus sp. FACHB-46]MBD1860936.1 hypothetical protein [Trichocoleus sp. FACHB-46]
MIYPRLRRYCLAASVALSTALMVGGSAIKAAAIPDDIFTPHLAKISQGLPPNLVMRLPSQIRLSGPGDRDFIDELIVKVFPSQSPPGMTVGLFTCDISPQPCLIGSFSVDSKDSESAQIELKKHQAAAAPIKLAEGVRGYFLPGPSLKPASRFSSVIWEQNGLVYTVSFFSGERQNILNMAHSMANNPPINRVITRQTMAR